MDGSLNMQKNCQEIYDIFYELMLLFLPFSVRYVNFITIKFLLRFTPSFLIILRAINESGNQCGNDIS